MEEMVCMLFFLSILVHWHKFYSMRMAYHSLINSYFFFNPEVQLLLEEISSFFSDRPLKWDAVDKQRILYQIKLWVLSHLNHYNLQIVVFIKKYICPLVY